MRTLKKPYGYQKDHDIETLQKLRQCLGANLEQYLDYHNSPTMSYDHWSRMDNGCRGYLQAGKDITPFISVADWADATFSRTDFMGDIIKKSPYYLGKTQEYLYQLDNAELLLENFLLYQQEQPESRRREAYHRVIPDFCEVMIYAYQNNPVDKSLALFKKTFDIYKNEIYTQDAYKDTAYWSGRIIVLLSHALNSRQTPLPILNILRSELDIEKCWNDGYSYLIADSLFKVPLYKGGTHLTDNFKIVEDILSPISQENIMKKVESLVSEGKHIEKSLYYLRKNWSSLTPEECNKYIEQFFLGINKPGAAFCLENLYPLMDVITPLDKVLSLFESKYFFSDKIKDSEIYGRCHESLQRRKLFHALDAKLEDKDNSCKKIKI